MALVNINCDTTGLGRIRGHLVTEQTSRPENTCHVSTTPRPVPNAAGTRPTPTCTPGQSHASAAACEPAPRDTASFHVRAGMNPHRTPPSPRHASMPRANAPPPAKVPPSPHRQRPPQAPLPINAPPPINPPPPIKTPPIKPPTHSKHKAKPIDLQSTYLYINIIKIICPPSFLPSLSSFPFYRQPLPCARSTKIPAPKTPIPKPPTPALPTTYHPATSHSVRTNPAHRPSMDRKRPPRRFRAMPTNFPVAAVRFQAHVFPVSEFPFFSAFRIVATFFPPTPDKNGHTTKMLTIFNELTIFAGFTLKMRFSKMRELSIFKHVQLTIFQCPRHRLPSQVAFPAPPALCFPLPLLTRQRSFYARQTYPHARRRLCGRL